VEYINTNNNNNIGWLLGEVLGLDKVVVIRVKQRAS